MTRVRPLRPFFQLEDAGLNECIETEFKDGEASTAASVIFKTEPCVGQYLKNKESADYGLIHFSNARGL